MDFNNIGFEIILLVVISLFVLISMGILFYTLRYTVQPYLERKNTIKEMEVKNRKFELFSQIDIKLINQEIDDLIQRYLEEYVMNNVITDDSGYLKKDQVELMVREITKKINIELSEMYIFYIKILVSVDNGDDLIKFIYTKVRNRVIDFVAQYNAPK